MKTLSRLIFCLTSLLILSSGNKSNVNIEKLAKKYTETYKTLAIPALTYDYREYFKNIPNIEKLEEQAIFFRHYEKTMSALNSDRLTLNENILADHLAYEIRINLERIELEKKWVIAGRKIPVGGLFNLADHRLWYNHFIKRFCTQELKAEDIADFGRTEVNKIQKEIRAISLQLGFKDSLSFYKHLSHDSFFLTSEYEIMKCYKNCDSLIRIHLPEFTGRINIPEVYPIQWPDAGAYTPPGMYLSKSDNAYGKAVFLYNFYGARLNRRSIEWTYMHEAIPGHHLQWTLREKSKPDVLQTNFIYPGNFEGWACYVEYHGKKFGLYQNVYSYLGRLEWDLVRSARLVIETGIHYYGWDREKAMAYWNKNLQINTYIAEREISRVMNWPAQALTYKTGALCIMELKNKMMDSKQNNFDEKKFHRCFLSFGSRPMSVITKHFQNVYNKIR